MRIVFMGTPEFAIPSLQMLINENYNIVSVVTQMDKPKGRGHNLAMPPVKELALDSQIPVLQPEKLKTEDFINQLKNLNPDLLITVAYGKILPKEVLDIPKFGCVNVHASLLPQYRGAAPINWAIINGERKTGITTMYTDIGMDTGDILLKKELNIELYMNAGHLHDELAKIGSEVLLDTLNDITNATLKRVPQDNENATYAPMLKKELGHINWERTAFQIHNLVRGTNPWPGAYCFHKGCKLNIWKTEFIEAKESKQNPGQIYKSDKDGILVGCKDGLVNVLEVQTAGCRKMSVRDYLCGHRICEGEVFE